MLRARTVAVLGCLLCTLGAACDPGARRAGPGSHAPGPASWQPAQPAPPEPPGATTELTPPSQPALVTFSELPPLRFAAGPALRLQPIAKQANITALSPDEKSWVLELGSDSRLITPAQPDGIVVDVWNGAATFSVDGRYVALWSYQGPLRVFDVASGALRAKSELPTCAARFRGPDEVVFHTSSKQDDARLLRLPLAGGSPAPMGGARAADSCRASLDGTRWLVETYDRRWFVDEQGRQLALPRDPSPGSGVAGALASSGDRLCTGSDAGFSCVRYPDGAIENVWSRPSSDQYVVFDPSGKRAMFRYAPRPDGVNDGYALVDFEARSVRRLDGMKWYSGSMPAFTHGGALLTVGSGQGLHVYDVDRGQKRLAAHRPLYGNFTFPHLPRTLVAGTDEPMDLFLIRVP